jgi:chromosome segregation ATPase
MSERERIACEELQADDIVQEGDEWLNPDGRWQALVLTPGEFMEVGDGVRARRPHNITRMLREFASQTERLAEARAVEKQLCDSLDLLRCEYSKSLVERDQARAEATKLSTDLWARKPLEDRVTSLTDEVAQLQLERQEQIDRYNAEVVNALQVSEQLTEAKAALKSAQRARDELQLQVDELRVDRDRLQGLIDDLVDEPTAQQVQDMLRTWATELDWSAGCFDSAGRDKVSAVQRVLVVVIERIGSMIDPEDSYAND